MLYKRLLIKPAFNILGNKYTIAGNQFLEIVHLQGLTGSQLPTTELTEARPEGGSPPEMADGSIQSWHFNTQRFKTNSNSSSHSCSWGKPMNHQFTTCCQNQLQASTPDHTGMNVRYIQHCAIWKGGKEHFSALFHTPLVSWLILNVEPHHNALLCPPFPLLSPGVRSHSSASPGQGHPKLGLTKELSSSKSKAELFYICANTPMSQ